MLNLNLKIRRFLNDDPQTNLTVAMRAVLTQNSYWLKNSGWFLNGNVLKITHSSRDVCLKQQF